jgi:hypothetical protein
MKTWALGLFEERSGSFNDNSALIIMSENLILSYICFRNITAKLIITLDRKAFKKQIVNRVSNKLDPLPQYTINKYI